MDILGAKACTRIRRTPQPRGSSGRRPPPLEESSVIRINIQPPTDSVLQSVSDGDRQRGVMLGITKGDLRTTDQHAGILADLVVDTRGYIYEVRALMGWNSVIVHKECILVRIQERDQLRDELGD